MFEQVEFKDNGKLKSVLFFSDLTTLHRLRNSKLMVKRE